MNTGPFHWWAHLIPPPSVKGQKKTSLTGSYQVSFLCNGRVSKLNAIVFYPTKNAESSCRLAGFCLETFLRIITWINNENFWSTVNFLLISL